MNRIRGNFTEQYTNSGFDAHPYPLNVAESPRIPSYRETFGFSLGGPLVIPHVYHGGNKTSWFASYNLQRGRTGLDSFSTVPTAAERRGRFFRHGYCLRALRGHSSDHLRPLVKRHRGAHGIYGKR